MNLRIRPMRIDDIDSLIQLTLLAFEPVFSSFARILGPQIYHSIYPDWKTRQADEVKTAWDNEKHIEVTPKNWTLFKRFLVRFLGAVAFQHAIAPRTRLV